VPLIALSRAALWALAGCASQEASFPQTPPCDTERRVTFDTLPSGPLVDSEIDGVRTFSTGVGAVEVQHDGDQAALIFVQGAAAFVPDCLADEVELVLDDSQGPLQVALLESPYGGDAFLTVSTEQLSTTPVDADYKRAVVERGAADPKVARADLAGGSAGTEVAGVALREVAFRTTSPE
jgi:hypothetical protein